ncbi:hypothetical protein [Cupriavidus sp. D384]|uniref:hypothetical protein n=1 Tax=Cupriavidus sp. D384 TaxID=1538095 RepID=UPI000B03FCE7|nr:hypothetical protein [Cupriavidus sp. D384]
MTHGKLPSTRRTIAGPVADPIARTPAGRFTRHLAASALVALGLTALTALSGCASESKSFAPPRGSITDDRAIGDILVKFTPPEVTMSEDAGKLLADVQGPVRYIVKRPMSGGAWLVTAITASADVTLAQAVATLQAAPRVESATADRMLRPHRTKPAGRDMPNP